MNVETQRKNIVHRILDLNNTDLLNSIEVLLDNEPYVYSTSGNPISCNEFKFHLNKIINKSDSGEKGHATIDAKNIILRK